MSPRRCAGEPAAAARPGCADRNFDRNRAGAIDRARNPATAGRRNAAADDREGNAVAGTAIAPRGGENHVPGAVIGPQPCAVAASAEGGAAIAANAARIGSQRSGAPAGKSGKTGNRSMKSGHFLPAPDSDVNDHRGYASQHQLPRFIVANWRFLCHKPDLHRPADQGLPCRCPCGLSRFSRKSEHFQRSNEHFKPQKRPSGAFFCGR